jgi:hypothetical protein
MPRGIPEVDGDTLKKPFQFGQYLKNRSSQIDKWIRMAKTTAERQLQQYKIICYRMSQNI